MQYKFKTVSTLPKEADEFDGFCNTRITGEADGRPFCCDVCCEHDGRDVEIDHVMGVDVNEDWEFFELLCEHKPFEDALGESYSDWQRRGCP